ncbi:hypothetical protein LIG30_4668 [Burkholderia sp. lig30]|jgi:hypothetical protein|uniref:hypothetical protein n=1 Tax=Burkholderia sp. lig30 TaxID=1192124 RepID=UPI0004611B8E|nr:hypothetical protein [Burkholderia sp. lig30]KDB05833.1 hypothetical protein LIG30_4668 [Burkholderia sp. lig30]
MRRSRRHKHLAPDAPASRVRPEADTSSAEAAGAPADAPHDGDRNQGGTRAEGLDYQRDLGVEQDA